LAEARLFGGLIRRKQGARCSDDEFAAESTLFSLSLRVPQPSERRTDERLLAILPVVKLVTPGGAVLCRIKNISAGGIAAEVTGPVASDTAVEIEFSSDRRIPGTVVWTREGSAGIKFDAEIDLRQLLAARKPREGYRARPPRLEVSCPATVRLGGMFHQVEIRDISLGGLKVAINDWSCVGQAGHDRDRQPEARQGPRALVQGRAGRHRLRPAASLRGAGRSGSQAPGDRHVQDRRLGQGAPLSRLVTRAMAGAQEYRWHRSRLSC
jgi:hypothetical protein